MKEARVVIEGGVARFVYTDDLAPLASEGTVTRASHVEPARDYCPQCRTKFGETGCKCMVVKAIWTCGWVADMTPSGGPVIVNGDRPFETRQAALDAEREWLRKERGV